MKGEEAEKADLRHQDKVSPPPSAIPGERRLQCESAVAASCVACNAVFQETEHKSDEEGKDNDDNNEDEEGKDEEPAPKRSISQRCSSCKRSSVKYNTLMILPGIKPNLNLDMWETIKKMLVGVHITNNQFWSFREAHRLLHGSPLFLVYCISILLNIKT